MSYSSTVPESAPDASHVTWGLREVVYGILWALLCFVVGSLAIVTPVAEGFGSKTAATDTAGALASIAVDVAVVWGVLKLLKRRHLGWQALGFRAPQQLLKPTDLSVKRWRWRAIAALLAGGLFSSLILVQLYQIIVDSLNFGLLQPKDQLKDFHFHDFPAVGTMAIAVVFVAPVCEELFFRGFLFSGLRHAWGFVVAAVLSGVLFAGAHGQLGLIIPFGVVGAVFAWLYAKSRSIYISMSVHFLFNLIAFIAIVATNT